MLCQRWTLSWSRFAGPRKDDRNLPQNRWWPLVVSCYWFLFQVLFWGPIYRQRKTSQLCGRLVVLLFPILPAQATFSCAASRRFMGVCPVIVLMRAVVDNSANVFVSSSFLFFLPAFQGMLRHHAFVPANNATTSKKLSCIFEGSTNSCVSGFTVQELAARTCACV